MKIFEKGISLILLFCVVFLFCSCASVSPFIKNGKTMALSFVGREGDTVFFIDLKKGNSLISSALNINGNDLSRFFDAVVVADDQGIYGIVEGDVPNLARGIIANRLKAIEVVENNLKCFKAKIDDKDFFFDLVYPGVILFSLDDYNRAYDVFVKNRSLYINDDTSRRMQSHIGAVYGLKPVNKVSNDFKKDVIDNILITFDTKNDNVVLNGNIKFLSKEAFNVFSTTQRQQFLKFIKESDIKIDFVKLLKSYSASEKNLSMSFKDCELPLEFFKTMGKK